jgi:hypothetical protein
MVGSSTGRHACGGWVAFCVVSVRAWRLTLRPAVRPAAVPPLVLCPALPCPAVGKERMEPLGIIVFSVVMGTAAFTVIVEGIKALAGPQQSSEVPMMGWVVGGESQQRAGGQGPRGAPPLTLTPAHLLNPRRRPGVRSSPVANSVCGMRQHLHPAMRPFLSFFSFFVGLQVLRACW